MDPQRLSKGWTFVILATVALAAGCSASPPDGDDDLRRGEDDVVGGDRSGSSQNADGTGGSTPGGSTSPGGNPASPGGNTSPGGNPASPGAADSAKLVVALGDSYMRLPFGGFLPGNEGVDLSLNKISGKAFRSYAYTGALGLPPKPVAMANGVIPGQFKQAKAEGDVKTVILSGGANDLPQGGGACKGPTTEAELNAECRNIIATSTAATDKLMADMASQGVQDVIWVGYGPTNPANGLEGAIAAFRSYHKSMCAAATAVRCHYIDNHAANIPTREDGIHPSTAGYETIGKAVWERMQQENVTR